MNEERMNAALRRIRGLVALASLAACTNTDGLPEGTLGVTFFPASIDGNLAITQGGTSGSGTRMSVDDDLDLDNDFIGVASLELDDGPLRLGLHYLPFAFAGQQVLGSPVVFHGTTFPAGDEIDSTLDLTTWAARVDTALIEDGSFELRVGGGAYWWELDLELRDLDTGATDSRKFSRLLPAITTTTSTEIGAGFGVRFDGAFAALDEGRRLVDAAAQVEYGFDERMRASVGWRWLRYWLNEDTNTGLLDLSGPTLAFTLRL